MTRVDPPINTAPPGLRTTGRLQVDGAQIHYEVWGRGPALVFAHGLGGNHMSWWQQVGDFSSRYTCVTFSHRGFAPSSIDTAHPDPRCYADDLAALVDHLQLGPVPGGAVDGGLDRGGVLPSVPRSGPRPGAVGHRRFH